MLGVVWAALLTATAVIAGWTTLGVVLGLSYGVMLTPSIWTAFRTADPSGYLSGDLVDRDRRGHPLGLLRRDSHILGGRCCRVRRDAVEVPLDPESRRGSRLTTADRLLGIFGHMIGFPSVEKTVG